MKQKLLLFILPMLFLATFATAQNHVWDFGNDTTNWPVNPTALTTTTVVDGLTLEPGGGGGFGIVEANSATWFGGTPQEYTSVNRFRYGGASYSSSSDTPATAGYTPTRRYLTFPVDGPVAVKVWIRPGGDSTPRSFWITDGTSEVTHFDSPGNQNPVYVQANYTGGAGNLYVFCAQNAFNIYKLEISSTLLSSDDFNSPVSTNIKSFGSKIYVSNVIMNTEVNIYSITGALVKSFETNENTDFSFKTGLWIATLKTDEGQKAVKLVVQ